MRAPPEIRQLPDAVANQIAAGEVIERPAAVVKELAENSLDAGATRIVVRCEDGGRRLVEVADDGHGMRPDDLRRALARHATSKLRDADDLFRVGTLGFRGEALPSIAAVSELEIASRPHDVEAGQRLAANGGVEAAWAPVAMAPGTRVSVRNLFWNVPVRLKFLKSEAAESGHVAEQVVRLALGHPRVAFALEQGGRRLIDLPPDETLQARCRTLFGRDLADGLLAVAETAGPMQIAGFVAHPREAKATARRQYLFLNGRHVRDRLLIAAVRDGFKGFLEPRLHGAVFLALDLDPSLVDVNVHPTKSEVRFRREGEVFALVSRAIQAVLARHVGGFSLLAKAAAAEVDAPLATASAIVQRTVVKQAEPPQPAWQERFLPDTPRVEGRSTHGDRGGADDRSTVIDPSMRASDGGSTAPSSAAPARSTASGSTTRTDGADASRVADQAVAYRSTPAPDPHLPGVRRVIQLDDMYLLVETDSGIRLVDQHALHEKALWLCLDDARTELGRGGVQELVVPRTVELSAAEVAAVEPLLDALAEHGIRAEVFGPTTLLLRAQPAALKRLNWTAFFADLAATGSGAKAVANVRERIGHGLACHGAIKAGQRLAPEEQLELVRLLYRLERMEHCPHGRPTTLDLSWGELARRFQR